MPGKLRGFDWDDANQHHILRHGVIPKEVEEAVSRKNVILTAKTVKREKRWKLFGKTFAYDMNANERRTYAPKLD